MAEKILIIDDDLDTLKLVGLMLQKQSYQIVAANNGQQGLEQDADDSTDGQQSGKGLGGLFKDRHEYPGGEGNKNLFP